VFDMGGGTLDVAVLSVAGGARPRVDVLAAAGVGIGGDALDTELARDIAGELAGHGVDVLRHERPELAWALLERAARDTKTRLSHVEEDALVLPAPLGYPRPVHVDRVRLERALRGQMDGAETLALSALRAARATRERLTAAQLRAIGRDSLTADVDVVLLTGGMSRVPYLGRRLAGLFPRARLDRDAGVGADETVAAGLADASGYADVTLPRPTFDVTLEHERGRVTLYEAFTPVFPAWEIYSGYSSPGYEVWLRPADLPATGEGRLRLSTLYGREIRVEVDGRPGLPAVRFGPEGVLFRLGSDATVELRDGLGARTALKVDGWPVIADPSRTPLVLRRVP